MGRWVTDVFVASSREDNLPNTVAEVLSCGMPCVMFAIGGMPGIPARLQKLSFQAEEKAKRSFDAKIMF